MRKLISFAILAVMWAGVASALQRQTIVHDSHDNHVFAREKVVLAPDESSTIDGGFGADAEQYGGTGSSSTIKGVFRPLSTTHFSIAINFTETNAGNGTWFSTGIGVQPYKSGVLSVEGIGTGGLASATIVVTGSNSASSPTDSQDGIPLQNTIHVNGIWVYTHLPRWVKIDIEQNSSTIYVGWKMYE